MVEAYSMIYTLFNLFISAPSASNRLLRLFVFNSPHVPSHDSSNARSLNLSLAEARAAWRIFVACELESDSA
jgi:hypothetical protein